LIGTLMSVEPAGVGDGDGDGDGESDGEAEAVGFAELFVDGVPVGPGALTPADTPAEGSTPAVGAPVDGFGWIGTAELRHGLGAPA
jgi:hypothetical protein